MAQDTFEIWYTDAAGDDRYRAAGNEDDAQAIAQEIYDAGFSGLRIDRLSLTRTEVALNIRTSVEVPEQPQGTLGSSPNVPPSVPPEEVEPEEDSDEEPDS